MAEGMEIIRRITPEEEYNAGLVIFRQGGVTPRGWLVALVDGAIRGIVRVATTVLAFALLARFFGQRMPCRHLAAR
ncbi:MAG: hypothetical protein ACLVB5_14650 [Christensenellales bacterium]